MKRKIKK